MNGLTIARAIHIVSIVIWIGGVSFVTLVMLPAIKSQYGFAQQESIFHLIENRFAKIAKWMVLIAGMSGFYMVDQLSAWGRFTQMQFFWMHAMVLVWLIFTLALFIVEPLLEKRHPKHSQNPKRTLQVTLQLHIILLMVSLVTVFISVLGAHGML
jgi:uncharacterized membrane protein